MPTKQSHERMNGRPYPCNSRPRFVGARYVSALRTTINEQSVKIREICG